MPVLCMPWLLWKPVGGGLSMAPYQMLHSAPLDKVLQSDYIHSLNLLVVLHAVEAHFTVVLQHTISVQ